MTGQLGTWSLGAGLAASVAATLLWLRLALIPATPVRPARLATGAGLLAALGAFGALEWALLRHDFGLRFVAENGGRDVSPYYTFTSLWSALDGSLLLWLVILAGYAGLLARTAPAGDRRLHHWAMSVVSLVAVFFFALSYFAANPFHPVSPVPADGPGPNPLLREHPAMGWHPPLLYAGYVGLVVPFGYAIAGLLAGRSGRNWAGPARRWTLLAWALLTAGILLGAWWSYAVLGWGGYWAWDPVENASLLPWLTATAFLHTLLTRRGPARVGWPAALACASFLLVLAGTFLTRSGVVASVHAFTESPLGPMLLGFLLLVATATVVLIGWRAGSTPDPTEATLPRPDAAGTAPPLSRATALLGNRILLSTIATVVLVGTVFPPIAEAVSGTAVAVGPVYYHRTAVPLSIALLTLMGLAVLLPPTGARPAETARRVLGPAAAGLAVVAAVGLASRPGPMALAAFGCAGFSLAATVAALCRGRHGDAAQRRIRRWPRVGGALAHAGIALVAAGVAASSAYTVATERQLPVGETLRLSAASVRLTSVDRVQTGAGMTVRARLALGPADRPAGTLVPQLRYHPQHDTTVSRPAIRSGPFRDTYATLLAVSADGRSATVRLAVNPMVALIWVGGLFCALGGLLALGTGLRLPRRVRAAHRRAGREPVAAGPTDRPDVPAAGTAVRSGRAAAAGREDGPVAGSAAGSEPG
ncbi:heme lyase CcmF/NrfE family subunit [Plantactinospora sp. WMMB334]|uniref:heme lyase CcmF/NrfE family subunit n=1 Tax=Plantactinospora sp. WMMB334 TaxID=3404119 RepID=UPI003B95FC44